MRAGKETYAIPVLAVRELTAQWVATSVPAADESITGLANVRGEIIPVVDLALRCGASLGCQSERPVIVVVAGAVGTAQPVALLVDEVIEVVTILPESRDRVLDVFSPAIDEGLIYGIGHLGDGIVWLIVPDMILRCVGIETVNGNRRIQ
jgi:purine-binding chemotaxis protein CheW